MLLRTAPRPISVPRPVLIALIVLAALLALPPTVPAGDWSYLDTLRNAAATLRGQAPPSDLVQDVYGARVLWADPYPSVGAAAAALGLYWPIAHASTHPPSAFLLVAPVAWLPWPVASALWAWVMVACLVASLWAIGVPRPTLVGAVLLLWPPVALSLGQLTLVWLLGAVLAYRYRDRPAVAGACIALASLPKFFPALLLVPYLRRRQWGAVWGFGAVWAGAVTLSAPAWLRWLNAAPQGETIARLDNAAMLPTLWRVAGWPGVVAGVMLCILVALRGRWDVLAVALLPIAWVYSLAPLLPAIWAARRSPWAFVAFALPVVTPPWDIHSPPGLCLSMILFAVAAVLHARPEPVHRRLVTARVRAKPDAGHGDTETQRGDQVPGQAVRTPPPRDVI